MKASERLWLNQDRTKVVKEGHKDGRSLLAGVGQDIPKQYEHLVKEQGKVDNKDAGKPPENKSEEATGENKPKPPQIRDLKEGEQPVKEIKFGGN